MLQGVEYDDLSEAAGMALTHAATKFDVERGIRLSTYAWPSIHRRLSKLVDKQAHIVKLPDQSRQRMRQLNETYHSLLQVLGRPPSIEEVAAEVRIAVLGLAQDSPVCHRGASICTFAPECVTGTCWWTCMPLSLSIIPFSQQNSQGKSTLVCCYFFYLHEQLAGAPMDRSA